ncbi:N-acetylmuramoyl-L-alanine amidase [Nonomuraea indica]|uniref:N-acetylmuramoyl-L-alanine amidase n=1 Tax=Nonomuraea indica TaxID=1581193 RepID=A0ABW8A6G7_9ACTN
MPFLTQLAAVAKRTGFPVTEVAGWRSRGHGPQPAVEGIVCHHTAGPAGGGDYPSLAVVRDGRPGPDRPLSHFGLGRSGRIYVVAAGRCWHNAPSTSSLHDNSSSLGIEAENNGSQPWPAAQLDAYRRLCAQLCTEFGLPAARVRAHREVNRQKPDPHSINMTDFRAGIARLIAGEDDMPTAKEIADAVYERLTHEVSADTWAAKQGILEPGQRVDARTAWRQTWAYGKDGYHRVREILTLLRGQDVVDANAAAAHRARPRQGRALSDATHRGGAGRRQHRLQFGQRRSAGSTA